MSNPSGTDHGEPSGPESDPITEEIDIPRDAEPPAATTGERRYTAPGFDAGSTQIIDRVPDAPTEFIATTPGARSGTGRPAPQAIPPRRGGRPRWLTAVLAGVALFGAAAIGLVVFQRAIGPKVSQEDRVRSTIQTFDNAVRDGDLATLRGITCGQERETYVKYDDKTWTETYAKVMAAKQYPVVARIDEVVVNGDHAEANVTSYMAFDPATTSTRSFDLQYRDKQWKICQSS